MFDIDVKDGGYGEHAVWNTLIKCPTVKTILDVRDDKNYQAADIDFLVQTIKLQIIPVEVKTDFKAHETGNIVYELTTSGNEGCFAKTKARYIAYFIPRIQMVHMIRMSKLREYIKQIQPKEVRMGDYATGYLLKISDLKEKGIIETTYEGVV